MSTATLEKSGAVPAAIPVTELLVEVFLDQIEPSPFNRKKFNEKQLEELAASIVLTDGVIEPVILRRIDGSKASYQLVAGERRWLASKRAVEKMGFQRKTIKSIVKTLTDAQAIELTLIENAQREDVHPLELCKTYKALMGQKDSTTGKEYTRELIAERVKKSYSLVCNILQADQLAPEIQKACMDGKISGSVALEICKYQPQDQEKIFLQCFGGGTEDTTLYDLDYKTLKEAVKDKDAEASISVRRLRDWIANNIHIDLTKAPFKTDDESLLKGVTSCVKCPKRTGSDPGLFAETQEVKKGDTCTDPGCYSAKKEAFIQIRIAEEQRKAAPVAAPPPASNAATPAKGMGSSFSQSAAAKAETTPAAKKPAKELPVQKISQEDEYNVTKEKGVLYDGDFTIAAAKCQLTQKAIWVDGKDIGKIIEICVEDNCQVHGYRGSSGSVGSRAPITFGRRMEIWQQKVQFVFRDELLKTIVARVPEKLGDREVGMIARHMLRSLDYHDYPKLSRIFGLKDNREALRTYVNKLKAAELARFVMACTFIKEIGIEGVFFSRSLGRAEELAVAAHDYKVNEDKLLEDAKAALEKKRPKTDAEKAAILKTKEKGKTDAIAKDQKKVNVVVKQIQKRGEPAKKAAKKKKGKK